VKRVLLWSLLGLLVLVGSLVSIVTVRVNDVEPLPPPDPARPIVFDDGSSMPLAEVLDRAHRGLPLPIEPPSVMQSLVADLDFKATLVAGDPQGLLSAPEAQGAALVAEDPVYALAEQNRADGKLDQALALYLSIPRESEHYARARRIVAWNILARDQDKPEQAVRYANDALHADPFDGNVWHDWSRVYARTLGLPVD